MGTETKRESAIRGAENPGLRDSLLSGSLWPLGILVPALLLVYTLPHVIALRNFLILALLIYVVWFVSRHRVPLRLSELKVPLTFLATLQLWLLIVSFFLAPDVLVSLREWLGQWFKSAMLFIAGVGVGLIVTKEVPNRSREAVTTILVILPFMALALIHCVLAVKYYSPVAYTSEYFGPSDHRANITYVAALGLPFVLVDITERVFPGRRLLPVPWYVSMICMALFLATTFTSGTRNGILVLIVVLAAWLMWNLQWLLRSAKLRAAFVLAVLSVCALAGVISLAVSSDSRWDRFVETAEIAWQAKEHAAWSQFPEHPLPKLRDGTTVEESAFLRVSFLKEGTALLISHPWGTEVTRHAFRNLLAAKYGKVNVFHSHIGVIDFGLSAGFPGIVIWMLFLASLGYLGCRAFSVGHNAIGLVLMFVVLTFFLRTFVDSTLREHIIQQFMLVAGLLSAIALPVKDNDSHE